jgi:3-deoxy-D-manno-octulosonic-acid transferase
MVISFQGNTHKTIWVHCSSLGEFEQGRPLIELIKKQNPAFKILLTFFSPSGYEIRKDYKNADWIYYLPMDSPSNAKRFLDIVQPHLILFVKYEFWYYYLNEIKKRQIPLLLVSGIFRQNQPFFAWYGNFHRNMLCCFTHIFVQNETSVTLLTNIGFKQHISISGDTRFDRVIEIADGFEPITLIENFVAENQVIVAGSTWTEDDEELDHYANTHPEIKFIIAPHDIEEDRIKECLLLYKNSILFSQLNSEQANLENTNVLIIDNIGMLSKLYRYATICYVGGAFGEDGVHNVLEAAVYSKPVVFGPEYDKYIEAVELIDTGGGFSIESAVELEKVLDSLLKEDELYRQTSFKAGNYVKNRSGATKKIQQYLYENRLLTN